MSTYWFWARLAQITIRKDKLASRDPAGEIWTNLVILRAENEAEAIRKAQALGQSDEGDCDGSLTLDGEPAVTKFIGIENAGLIHDALEDGTEILFELRRGRLSVLERRVKVISILKAELKREIAPYRDLAGRHEKNSPSGRKKRLQPGRRVR